MNESSLVLINHQIGTHVRHDVSRYEQCLAPLSSHNSIAMCGVRDKHIVLCINSIILITRVNTAI